MNIVAICPLCGEEADDFFVDDWNEVIGCNSCIRTADAFDWYMNRIEEERADRELDRRHDA